MSVKFSQDIPINLALIFYVRKKILEHSSYTYLHVEHISSQKKSVIVLLFYFATF
jgi:hypothetical protein